ncbi:MAG: YrbL family protein, partial [Gammaproteobacteria bacterium]
MQRDVLQINGEPLGIGQERVCYRHPDDAGKVVKIQRGESDTQTRRELELYRSLERRGMDDYSHLPRFYGRVDTNLGPGFVVDLVADFDGSVSKSLWWHFERGYPVAEFDAYLDELGRYLLENRIVFSVDMGRYNVLFQKLSGERARLVVIDGLGNHSAINWLDNFAYFARRKIERRWRRFIGRLRQYSAETMQAYDGQPQRLE